LSATLMQAARHWFLVAVVVTMLIGSASAGTKFRIMHTFAGGNDGSIPAGQLTFDSAGDLYGTTFGGGSTTACGGSGCGTVFKLAPESGRWSESVLANFGDATSNVGPIGPMAIDSAGNLYGTGVYGYEYNGQGYSGQLFQLLDNEGSYTESILHLFAGGSSDGAFVNPGLVHDSAGNLYGSAGSGGALNNNGVVFEFSPNGDGTWTESLPYTFGAGKCYGPVGMMAIDPEGNLYGTTAGGGVYGYGSVYKLSQSNGVWTIQSLYDFTPPPADVGSPSPSGVVIDAEGNLYGNTQFDGAYGVGSLYKLTPTKGYWTFSLIHSFTGSTDGGWPYGALTIDAGGNLYGSTLTGGVFQYGTVFKFVHGSTGRWTETVLHSFTDGTDGSQPQGVIVDSLGNVYGLAQSGGADQDGVAFEIMP
jgi:uncharacterized repeat protein (TIGR03803 family)